jgi:hypothetical protein
MQRFETSIAAFPWGDKNPAEKRSVARRRRTGIVTLMVDSQPAPHNLEAEPCMYS